MNDILQGIQMQNKIPDFIKKDTGGVLQIPGYEPFFSNFVFQANFSKLFGKVWKM